jgi:hypothetical protein
LRTRSNWRGEHCQVWQPEEEKKLQYLKIDL